MRKAIALLSLFTCAILITSHVNADPLVQSEGQLENAFSSWGKASVEGDWKIIEIEGKSYIELAENFRAKEGPDVKIFLSPLPSDEITGKNAAQDSAYIYQIHEFEGSNRILIPEGTDLTLFKTLVFHCEEYSKLWGVSPL